MPTTRDTAFDKRDLIRHIFERQGVASDTPIIEVVYEVKFPVAASVNNDTRILKLISITRTDTKEPVVLTPEEEHQVGEIVSEYAANMTEDW